MNEMNKKRRREFCLEDAAGCLLASGVLYDEGNVQILWRIDSGYTAEQYANVSLILNLIPGVHRFRFTPDEDMTPCERSFWEDQIEADAREEIFYMEDEDGTIYPL